MQLQKWGNSAAVRLPKELLNQINWKIGDTVLPEIKDGQLVLKAAKRPRYRLQDLLDEMGDDLQRADNWDTQPEIGKEVVEP